MKKFSILVVACALALSAAACSKKKVDTMPAAPAAEPAAMGGAAYGGATYADPCGGAEANPCAQ